MGNDNPTHLYKYKSIDGDNNLKWALDLILEGKAFYSGSPQVNDPFEFDSIISFDAEYFEKEKYFKQNFPHTSGRVIDIEKTEESIKSNGTDLEIAQRIKERFGVFCLTTDPLSIYMWSHYGNSHKGICVEFEVVNFNPEKTLKVQYQDSKALLNIYRSNEASGQRHFHTKHTSFKFENEFRLISAKPGQTSQINDCLKVSRIILGERFEPDQNQVFFQSLVDKKFQGDIVKLVKHLTEYRFEYSDALKAKDFLI